MGKVKLKYFSRIRETIGKTSELVEIKSTNIQDLIEELQAMGEKYCTNNYYPIAHELLLATIFY